MTSHELKGDIDAVYHELKDEIAGLRTEFKSDMSKMRTWVISLFVGSIIVIGTLLGTYANMTIALWRTLQ